MRISLYTLTSSLHDRSAVDSVSREFLSSIETVLGYGFDFRGDDFSSYGKSDLDVIFIRTGGSEGLFREVFPTLSGNILLLTSGKSNSLAASLEILSFLNQNGRRGEVLHGSAQYIAGRLDTLAKVSRARRSLDGQKLGIIGKPSDWLIASQPDKTAVAEKLGIELLDIDIRELIELSGKTCGTGAGFSDYRRSPERCSCLGQKVRRRSNRHLFRTTGDSQQVWPLGTDNTLLRPSRHSWKYWMPCTRPSQCRGNPFRLRGRCPGAALDGHRQCTHRTQRLPGEPVTDRPEHRKDASRALHSAVQYGGEVFI